MDEFDRHKTKHQYWYNKARHLRSSAGAVWYCMENDKSQNISKEMGISCGDSFFVFPMLCGLALELLYKAICVKNDKIFANTHSLEKLANIAGVSVPSEMLPTLKLFTESIIWDGKYPVPTDKKRQAFDEINNLWFEVSSTLTKTFKSLKIYEQNGEPSWDTFQKFWDAASDIYYN